MVGRPRLHGEDTRQRLVEAAGRLVAEGGPEALSVRRVADEVGTTTRALYSLFGSRVGLVQAVYAEGFAAFDQRLSAVAVTGDPTADLVAFSLAYRDHALADPARYRVMFERIGGFEPGEAERAVAQRTLDRLRQLVRRCVRGGVFPGRDVDAVTLQWWAFGHGLASFELQGLLGAPADAERHWRDAMAAALAGYGSVTTPRRRRA